MPYRTKNTPVQITVPNSRESISGLVNTAMLAGSLVQYDSAATIDTRVLIAANGGVPAILEGTVVSDADWQTYCKLDPMFNPEIRKKVPVGSAMTARFAHEAEFEGAAYFTGITANTAAGSALKCVAGKFALATVVADRVVGHLGRLVTSTDSGTFRWTVDFIN